VPAPTQTLAAGDLRRRGKTTMRVVIAACLLVLAITVDAAELTLSAESRKRLALAPAGG
jgi:hypothetical protein